MFRVGQQVVCVDAFGATPLKEGAIYTVTRLTGVANAVGFILIRNGGGEGDGGWFPARFRPLVERKAETDIGFAHEILRKATKRKPATV